MLKMLYFHYNFSDGTELPNGVDAISVLLYRYRYSEFSDLKYNFKLATMLTGFTFFFELIQYGKKERKKLHLSTCAMKQNDSVI